MKVKEDGSWTSQWENPTVSSRKFVMEARHAFARFQEAHVRQNDPESGYDTTLHSFIQSGPLAIREEEAVLGQLFAHLGHQLTTSLQIRPLMHLTTGYFALSRDYQHRLIASGVDCQVLVASPEVRF